MNLTSSQNHTAPSWWSVAFACAALFSSSAFAADQWKPINELVLTGGVSNIRHNDARGFGLLQAQFAADFHGLHPFVQLGATREGSVYGGTGLLHYFELPHRMRLTVGTGPGLYRQEGNDPHLGYAVEFSSWIELSGFIMNRRVGLSFAHLSNAHLGSRNPGTEGVGISVHLLSW